MRVVGLTGGIASGKSTACRYIKELFPEIPIIDADCLSRQAVQRGHLPYWLLRWVLPCECFDRHGELIRSVLASLIFSQSVQGRQLKRLVERCIHPWVVWRIYAAMFWYWLVGCGRVVVDVPLLFEGRFDRILMMSTTILIDPVTEEVQLERLRTRNPGMTESEARNRIAAQMPLAQKRLLARWIVPNDFSGQGTFKDRLRQLWETQDELKASFCRDQVLQRLLPLALLGAVAIWMGCRPG